MAARAKAGFRTSLDAKRNRLKRRSGRIARDVFTAFILLGAVFFTGSLLVYSYNVILTAPWFQLEKTIVKGCDKTTERDVLVVSGVRSSQNILALSMDGIARKVRANPWIEDVSVVRDYPNRLIIEIRERKPVALVKRSDSLYFMDAEGYIFKKFEGEETHVPVLTGCSEDGMEDRTLIRKSIELIDFLSASNSFPQARNISEIHGDQNFGFTIFLDSGLCLHIGFGDYENKLKRLRPIMADLARKNTNQGFLLIDLHDPGKITVQKKDLPGFSKPGKGLRT